MFKQPTFQQLVVIGVLTFFGVLSFFAFAGMQYQSARLTSLEKERLHYYLSNLRDEKKEWGLSLLKIFEDHLKKSLSQDTSMNPWKWTESNPEFGQCAVSALIIQHFFGGEIMEAEIPQEWRDITWFSTHLWNRIEGQDIDFTKDQFPTDFPYDDLIGGRLGVIRPREKEDLLADQNIADNYGKVMSRLEKNFFNQ